MNINRFTRGIYLLYTQLFLKHKFKHISKGAIIFAPLQLDGKCNISIGKNSFVSEQSWLCANKESGQCDLKIGENVVIGHNVHIVSNINVTIEDSVLIADRVFISDCTHCYENINMPICKQKIKNINSVNIGAGSWIGENVSILGASIGKHCVIGANSVVTHNIPEFSVAIGSPARVIKKYDFDKNEWINEK